MRKSKKVEKIKKIAPLKNTSGEGYEYENSVVAYFLSFLLSNRIFDPSLGEIKRIDFQTRVDENLLDDIILTCEQNGKTQRCFISVKSNQQFSKKSSPQEFVFSAWNLYLHEVDSTFEKKSDFLCLSSSHLPSELSNDINNLLKMASGQDSEDLSNRLPKRGYVNNCVRNLFDSFSCPRNIATKHAISAKDIGNFLKCVKIFEFDFEVLPSEKLNSGLRNCQDILWDQSQEEAKKVWKELKEISRKLRHSGGYADIEFLVDALKWKFRLKDYPVHHNDWIRLEKNSKDYTDGIFTKIGDKLTIQRSEEVYELNSMIFNNKKVILLGSSGSGKTVLAKCWLDQFISSHKILWWDATWFSQEEISAFERKLNLTYPLSDLFSVASGTQNVIIVDGIDRLYTEVGFQRLSQLIRLLKLNNDKCSWRVIFTCQIEEWKRIRDALIRHNIDPNTEIATLALKELTEVELEQVWKIFPSLKKLRTNRSISPLLKKPKILDLLARHSSEIKNWAGESDFIEWFWEQEIQKGNNSTARSIFLQNFAARLADEWESGVAESEISGLDLSIVDELIRDHICKKYQYQISFFHDLYSDWARQRVLIGKQRKVLGYIKEKCDSPLWHRAIQLYGMHLLERTNDPSEWSELIYSLSNGTDTHSIAQDLVLESIIFAADPLPLLEKVWPELSKDDGKLLKSLLIRFQYIATVPNPVVQEKAREIGLDLTEAELIARLPYWPYWIPLIRFLSNHESEVIKFDPKSIADLGYTWIQQTPDNYPLRNEVARLVLAIAEDVREKQKIKDHYGCDKEISKSAYSAAIACIREYPDRVTKLILEICERSIPGERYRASHKQIIHSQIDGDLEYPIPWPKGPNDRIDSVFVEICIAESALLPLIRVKPELAKEVCLAIMIEPPRPRRLTTDSSYWDDEFGVNTDAKVYPAFYDKGPFLNFLRINSKMGLEVIIQLVNFATEQWGELQKKEHGETPYSTIILSDVSKQWIGDDSVYAWYRGAFAPDLLISALMAIEKFLYEQIDKNEPVDEFIEDILINSKSVAIGGLLIAIGKYKPALFLGALKRIFSVPEFFNWELGMDINSNIHFSPGWRFQSYDQQKIAQSWYLLPHRKLSYKDIAMGAFIKSPEIQSFFEPVKLHWQEQIKKLNQNDQKRQFIQILISWFDISNYSVTTDKEKGRCVIYNPPQHIVKNFQENEEPQIQEASNRLQLQTFIFACNDLLKNRNKCKEINPESIWDNLLVISTNQRYKIQLDYLSKEDAICGGCAVLLVIYPDYLKKNPDKEKWCKEQVLNILNNPSKSKNSIDSEENPVDFSWDSFCAWALPHIWANDLKSPKIREFILRLATDYHYKTVEILFESCGEIRGKLGEHFKELEHFILLWSATKNRLKFSQMEGTTFDIDQWVDVHALKFIEGRLSVKLPRLEDIENKDNKIKLRFSNNGKRTRLHLLGFDLKTIEAAFNWRKSLNNTLNQSERAEWIEFLKELLGFTLKQFGGLNSNETEYDGSPNEFDQWLFSRIAYNIAEFQSRENAKELWLPILNLGIECHAWVEKFLFDWGMNLYYFKDNPENFIREWKSMIDFAQSSSKWNYEKIRKKSDLDEMWCILLDLDLISSDKWDKSQKEFVNNFFSSYQASAPIILKRRIITEKFIAFLNTPAAEDLRIDGLVWIYSASIEVGSSYWNNQKMNERLA
ncbi:MAG TPA: hypothetical protein DCW42_04715, partial [Bacteroidetes bacterium]|nr:hypothetical protein [Bacteroidota bacterium]